MGWDVLCTVPHAEQGCAWEMELSIQEAAAGSRSSSMLTTIQPPPVFSAVPTYGVKLDTAMEKPKRQKNNFIDKISINFTNDPVLIHLFITLAASLLMTEI